MAFEVPARDLTVLSSAVTKHLNELGDLSTNSHEFASLIDEVKNIETLRTSSKGKPDATGGRVDRDDEYLAVRYEEILDLCRQLLEIHRSHIARRKSPWRAIQQRTQTADLVERLSGAIRATASFIVMRELKNNHASLTMSSDSLQNLSRTLSFVSESESVTESVLGPEGDASSPLKTLYEPDKSDLPTADIVFVHGLSGGRESTWSGSGCLWPRDFLKGDFPLCRISTYGYAITGNKLAGSHSLGQLGEKLLKDVSFFRAKDKANVPLVFVAHSFGGLVVKMALNLSKKNLHESQDIGGLFNDTIGIVFFGTPHYSTSSSGPVSFVRRLASVTTVQFGLMPVDMLQFSLWPDEGAVLKPAEFKQLLQEGRISIASFFETVPLLTDFGPSKIVDDSSALYHPLETIGYLPHSNHLNMCKFQHRRQRGYAQVVQKLQVIINEGTLAQASSLQAVEMASSVVAGAESPTQFSTNVQQGTEIDSIDVVPYLSKFHQSLEKPWASRKTISGGSAAYIRRISRAGILQTWLDDPFRRIFYIHGPSGSGKTTFALSALNYVQSKLQTAEGTSPILLYHQVSSEDGNRDSYRVILEALLSQLLEHDNRLSRYGLPTILGKGFKMHKRWTSGFYEDYPQLSEEALLEILLSIAKDSSTSQTYAIIDGLDAVDYLSRSQVSNLLDQLASVSQYRFLLTDLHCHRSHDAFLSDYRPGRSEEHHRLSLTPGYIESYDITSDPGFLPEISTMALQHARKLDYLRPYHSLQATIAPKLVEAHLNSFTLVKLNLDLISRMESDEDIRRHLGEIDAGKMQLRDLYKSFISQTKHRKLVVRTLCLLACRVKRMGLADLEMCLILGEEFSSFADLLKNKIPGLKVLLNDIMGELWSFEGSTLSLHSHHLRAFVVDALEGREPEWRSKSSFATMSDFRGKVWPLDEGGPQQEEVPVFLSETDIEEQLASACIQYLWLRHKASNDPQRKHASTSDTADFLHYARSCWLEHFRRAPQCVQNTTLVQWLLDLWRSCGPNYVPVDASPTGSEMSFEEFTLKLAELASVDMANIPPNPPISDPSRLKIRPRKALLDEMRDLSSDAIDANRTSTPNTNLTHEIFVALDAVDQSNDEATPEDILQALASLNGNFIVDTLEMAISKCRSVLVAKMVPRFKDILTPETKSRLMLAAVACQSEQTLAVLVKGLAIDSRVQHRSLFNVDDCLLLAARQGNKPISKTLLQMGANPDAADRAGCTSLLVAARAGNLDLVHVLIEWGAFASAKDNKGKTAVHYAAAAGNAEIVQFLLGLTSQADDVDLESRTPLFLACKAGQYETAETLLNFGSDPNASDEAGRSPLHAAVQKGAAQVVRLLLASGGNVNAVDQGKRTPLHDAARHGWAPILQDLLTGLADVDPTDREGYTPLMYACKSEKVSESVLDILLKNHANIRACTTEARYTALHLAAEHGNVAMLSLLADAGADVNSPDKRGQTPLYAAARAREDFEAKMMTLFEKGARIDWTDDSHLTPLQYALQVQKDRASAVARIEDNTARASRVGPSKLR